MNQKQYISSRLWKRVKNSSKCLSTYNSAMLLYFIRKQGLYGLFPLRRYVQTTGKKNHLLMEMVEMLENMEASTLNLLMDIVTDIAEVAVQFNHKYTFFLIFKIEAWCITCIYSCFFQSHLKKYFKSDRRRFCLCSDIEQYFPKLPYAFDEQQVRMHLL